MTGQNQKPRNDGDREWTAEIMPSVIAALSYLLQRVAEKNDELMRSRPLMRKYRRKSGFHGLTKPSISIRSYVERIFKYANCSHSCYIVAYIYLDRFVQKQPFSPIDSFNVHRLIITSVLVSSKFMDDKRYNNGYYAKIGGISGEEMNVLEMEFLFGLGFQLNVTPSTFSGYSSFLHSQRSLLPQPSFGINPRDEESPHRKQQLAVV
ncbi:PREDICTED: cyclin-U4-3-like [Tarenaya hassleriana]|uniref:cyclin-U4-3-like n=1 Tax=Tarenaya hassleriana TaxID=28532 RepID=UPI00053C5C4B|nr:PREDICTED: cyclin-U4-3-like [Tarenaya hassleriana]